MNVLNTIKREGRPPQDAQKKNNPDQNSEENSNLIVGEPKPPISQGVAIQRRDASGLIFVASAG